MPMLIHIAEVALLLAVAYTLGWAIGYAGRRVTARPSVQPAATIPPERLAAVTGQPVDPLVKTPLILPLPVAGPEAQPQPLPEPLPASAPEPPPVIAVPPAAMPATRPGEAWAGEIRGRAALPFRRTAPQRLQPPPDEDAAMRAIEGGWTRTHTRAMADAPELSDLGVAVAAAQTAVEQVIARLETEPAAKEQE